MLYLSPAFSIRSAEDLVFLKGIDGTTGFSLFWIDVIRPLLEAIRATRLLQIGAYKGEHTRLLLEYCEKIDGSLTVIEPFVMQELHAVTRESSRCRLIEDKSRTAIPRMTDPVDVVLLNGDLNYHTVYNDLSCIDEMSKRAGVDLPVVILKSMSWPYARRDMYYDPNGIPAEARKSYTRMGMNPWLRELQEGGINSPFYNADHEGGPHNGVLTAVEDFMATFSVPLRLFTLPINHGLGILYRSGSVTGDFIDSMLSPPSALRSLLETCEIARLNDIIERLRPSAQKQNNARPTLARRIYSRIRRSFSN